MTAARAYNAENPNLQMLYLDKEKIRMAIYADQGAEGHSADSLQSKSREGSHQVVLKLSPSRPRAVPK